MVNVLPTYLQSAAAKAGAFSILEMKLSSNDTFTLSDYTAITNVVGMREDTQATLAFSIVGNVVTVTTAGLVGVVIIVIAAGSR